MKSIPFQREKMWFNGNQNGGSCGHIGYRIATNTYIFCVHHRYALLYAARTNIYARNEDILYFCCLPTFSVNALYWRNRWQIGGSHTIHIMRNKIPHQMKFVPFKSECELRRKCKYQEITCCHCLCLNGIFSLIRTPICMKLVLSDVELNCAQNIKTHVTPIFSSV